MVREPVDTATPDEVLDFWFGPDADRSTDSAIAGRQSGLWWGKDADVDAEIDRRFGPLIEPAATGRLDQWKEEPEGWLALILLTDQFPRNAFRDSPKMFSFDGQARALCVDGIEAGVDRRLRPIHRVFFYLPLEHSEDADDQSRCVALMRSLVDQVDDDQRDVFRGFVDYAIAHQRVIDRFGRFPHRNPVLGRESSEEERAFLREPGSSF